MKQIKIGLISGLFFLGLVITGNAALLDIGMGNVSFAGHLPLNPGSHDVEVTQGADGWFNANLFATEDVTLTYEYLGADADWTNSLWVDEKLAFTNRQAPSGPVDSNAQAGSLLNFGFRVLDGGNAGYGVKNGANTNVAVPNTNNNYSAPNFFLGYADGSHNSVYIALDDGGGDAWSLNPFADDDHDDLVIKVTATPVPVPATLLLFFSGLLGLMGSRIRRTEK